MTISQVAGPSPHGRPMDDKAKIVAQGRWLNRLAAIDRPLLATVLGLPLLAGSLLVAQALVLAALLHRAIVEGAGVGALLPQVLLLATILVIRIALGGLGEAAAVRFGEAIKQRPISGREAVQPAPLCDNFRLIVHRPTVWRRSGNLAYSHAALP